MDLGFLSKFMMGLYDLDLSYYLVSADNSNYNLRHANYQFKIRYARTVVLKFSYFFRVAKSWNSLLLHFLKTFSRNALKHFYIRRIFLHSRNLFLLPV